MYSYNDAITILINKFSELKQVYDENIEEYRELPYVFYESVFTKYIVEKIQLMKKEDLIIICNFLENLIENGDDEIKNLVEVSVIESIYYEKDFEKFKGVLMGFCGNLTKLSFEKCYSNW